MNHLIYISIFELYQQITQSCFAGLSILARFPLKALSSPINLMRTELAHSII